jgi:hypothetical protein
MKTHKPKKKRATAANSGSKRQVIYPTRKSLTMIHHITFQFVCEMKNAPTRAVTGDIDNEWENWAAAHRSSAL